jgi:hypothetical protein
MQSINGSHIVLLPKKNAPVSVVDYHPISLSNTSVKLLTKLMSNRLQKSHHQVDSQQPIWLH